MRYSSHGGEFGEADRPCHMWTAPIGKWFSFVLNVSAACGHMSGLFMRIFPLALMKFDGEGPSKMRALKLVTGYGVSLVFDRVRVVHHV
ncbi:MAG: hypothetical protein ACREWG_15980, partial [Gammaproteobacteria bacterium]